MALGSRRPPRLTGDTMGSCPQVTSEGRLASNHGEKTGLESLPMRDHAIPQKSVETTDRGFEALGLSVPVLESLRRVGFEHPTPVQAGVIPLALAGRDVIGLAETGTGKTAAFVLPILENLRQGHGPRCLILCPTREIALQTLSFFEAVGRPLGLLSVCLIGGVKIQPQIQRLRKGVDAVVATPGRLLDHAERGTLVLAEIEELVLDEADHMLDLGFLPQILAILERLPAARRTMMFSATMPPAVDRLAQRLLRQPIYVDLRPAGGVAEGISHRLYLVEEENKKPCLLALARGEPGSMLIFLRRKVDAEWACRQLELEGHPVERIHSDRSQGQRVAALEGFREGEHRILVATDIAARGLDIPRIQHIVNFDPPATVEDYIHRAGRTARGTAKGTVSTIATWMDRPMIREIEGALGQELPRCTAPGVEPYLEPKTTVRGRKRIRRRLL